METLLFRAVFSMFAATLSIRKAGGCGRIACQVIQRLKRATTFDIPTILPLLMMHCVCLEW